LLGSLLAAHLLAEVNEPPECHIELYVLDIDFHLELVDLFTQRLFGLEALLADLLLDDEVVLDLLYVVAGFPEHGRQKVGLSIHRL
jgi:hypothetical protein